MKITAEWLKEKCACREGFEWWKKQKETDALKVLDALIKTGELEKLQWANWTLVRLMDKPQRVAYAIFAAEQVLHIFEKKYPKDDRPRKAIEAAKAYLADPSDENKRRAAAAYAAAAYAAAAYAADDADAAYAAAAADDAAAAAYAAAAADDADADAAAARIKMLTTILEHGISLLAALDRNEVKKGG